MVPAELYALAARMRELSDPFEHDPMSEDQQTEFIELGVVLASHIAPEHITLKAANDSQEN